MRLLRWLKYLGFLSGVCTLTVVLQLPLVQAQEPRITLAVREPWSNWFAGKDLEFPLVVQASEPFQGRLLWQFSLGPAVVVRKEAAVAAFPDKPAQVRVSLPGQKVREGVVLEGRLTVAVYADQADKPAASYVKALWIFPENPFAGKGQWLKELQITLFDSKGATAELLQKGNIPFAQTGNLDALGELKAGLLLIGEGTSFQEDRGLAEAMVAAAARGLVVLCLAPAEGALPIPGAAGSQGPAPASLSFRSREIIARLDKRLDPQVWSAAKKGVASGLVLKAEGANVIGEVSPGPGGWPWLDVHFAQTKGRLLVCGFGVVSQWEVSPAPRFLLLRLLEFVTEKDKGAPTHERTVEK